MRSALSVCEKSKKGVLCLQKRALLFILNVVLAKRTIFLLLKVSSYNSRIRSYIFILYFPP